MQVSLPEKVIHCGGGMRYRPPRSALRSAEEDRAGVQISFKASIAITRPVPPVIEIRANEEAAEFDPRGRVVDMIV